ncbi:MAG: hypothetical protein KF893_12180 [Caldilineaceae bacterium]|nr:hypothetical protein [Caldilineaceae bacterium]
MERQRIQVYADPEMKRRIELAAAKHNVAVTEYCLDAIRQRLADDEMLDATEVTIAINPTQESPASLLADLRLVRETILADREGQFVDVDAALDQTRDERIDELIGLR